MKRSPVTLNSKNMGSAARLRTKSILWSNLKQCSSNRAASNGKIKALNVRTLQHYSSGLLNGVLSRHDNSMERESNCNVNRSPWIKVAYRYPSLLQTGAAAKFCTNVSCQGTRSKSSKDYQQIWGEMITSLSLDQVSFSSVYLCQHATPKKTIGSDDWPPQERRVFNKCLRLVSYLLSLNELGTDTMIKGLQKRDTHACSSKKAL